MEGYRRIWRDMEAYGGIGEDMEGYWEGYGDDMRTIWGGCGDDMGDMRRVYPPSDDAKDTQRG